MNEDVLVSSVANRSSLQTEMINAFEGLRGLAALVVALFHLTAWAHIPIIGSGYLFVDLFFVLSGFVISAAYADRLANATQIKAFLVRRFGSLFPLLFVATALFILAPNVRSLIKIGLASFGWGNSLSAPELYLPTGVEVISTLALTHSLGFHDRLFINFVTWSISAEFWTYAIFAALCVVTRARHRLFVFLIISAACYALIVWASIVRHQCLTQGGCMSLTYDFGFPRCIASFFLGAAAAELRNSVRSYERVLELISVGAIVLIFSLVKNAPALAFVLPILFALWVWALASDKGWVAKILSSTIGAQLGERSYSIYALHPILLVLGFAWLRLHAHNLLSQLIVAGAYLVTLYVAAGWTYSYIEDPARRWFNGRAARMLKLANPTSSGEKLLSR